MKKLEKDEKRKIARRGAEEKGAAEQGKGDINFER